MLMESSLYKQINNDGNTDTTCNETGDGSIIIGEGVGFERIRRITGYLVGSLNRFNNAKLSEVNDRVCHMNKICN